MNFRSLPILSLSVVLSGCTLFSSMKGSETEEIAEKPPQGEKCEGPDCAREIEDPRPEQRSSWTFHEEPVPIAEREITFDSEGATLKATILMPETTEREVPGLVIVHDLGPHGRDGVAKEAFGLELPVEVPMYRTIAEQLASRGFAVMIYDKRSCVKGGAPWCSYPRNYVEAQADRLVELLIDDAASAAEALRDLEAVSDEHVGLIGHGQGAEIALDLAESNPGKFWRLVLVNPSAYPIDDLVLHQTDVSIETIETKFDGKKPSAERDEMQAQLDALRKKREAFQSSMQNLRQKDGEPARILDLPANVWLASFALHVRASDALKTLETPTLAVIGEADFDTPDDNAAVYDGLIAGNEAIEMVTMNGLSRLMVDLDEDPTGISEELMGEITEFLRSQQEPTARTGPDTAAEAR